MYYNNNIYMGQWDSGISLILSKTAVAPTNHLVFDSSSGAQSKQTHWPVQCCYLCSSAKAMNCEHALSTAKLPSAHKCSWLSAITSVWRNTSVVRPFTWQCPAVSLKIMYGCIVNKCKSTKFLTTDKERCTILVGPKKVLLHKFSISLFLG